MPSSKTTKKSTENAPRVAVKRAPKTREAQVAQRANEYALAKTGVSFGAPVSATQVSYYEAALKAVRKSKTNAQFLGFKSNDSALRALRPVAQGTTKSSSLPKATREAFDALYTRLTLLHDKDGRKNKTWPRKHAIVLVALLSEKPAKPKNVKPAKVETPTPQPVAETIAA